VGAGILVTPVRLDFHKPDAHLAGWMVVHEYASDEVARNRKCVSIVEGAAETPQRPPV
jgi:hypothetical protein